MSHRTEELSGNWNYPTIIHFGAGRIKELPEVCREMAMKHPLLVTDPNLAKLPMVQNAIDLLESEGIGCGLFHDIRTQWGHTNPTGGGVIA